ncbi:MAG TPA: hydrolase [Clostridium sp.]|uniref:MBL fold metallo-hydrolase n=1 Tax=Clostridium lapidicellarium TaxID=3240931 RepID=A0ABV4DVD9_9CLOT|nr:MBL fold metallo-hydrolase [uncultured Clostridium sp.]NLU07384.1 MBL fold metallo-hydrolase [Clostridiales bacterium]HBC95480.1 hydrolase [Clostridium sp.]
MKVKRVKGSTFCIDTGMTYIPFYKINEREIIMLDTGWAGERRGINEILQRNGFKVKGIICTHGHIDHVGNNSYLKEKYGCNIAMPAYEAFICSSAVNLKLYYNNQTLSDIKEHFGSMICKTDIMILNHQHSVSVGGVEFKIIHTPGHSPAHICIITPDDVAYLGDSLIGYEVMKGAKMPYAYILTEDLKSKKKLYGLNFSEYIVAHRGIFDNITKLVADNINFYKTRVEKIYDIISGSMTMEEIMKSVIKKFKLHVNSKYKYAVMTKMLESYVQYLDEMGVIKLGVDNGALKYSKIKYTD